QVVSFRSNHLRDTGMEGGATSMPGVQPAGGPPGGGPTARGGTQLVQYNPQSATRARLEDINKELGAQYIIGLTGTMRKSTGQMVEAYHRTTNHI
ncbi:MAG: hypothetical protein ACKPKO_08915, partial [Candidatus Fonsibacter sp.]